ncbi:MAG: hypothetical protein CL610_02085 [Anaerolineaceae bacterium]|nr:hypothetical protein [Anaerolineaceae bacterium]
MSALENELITLFRKMDSKQQLQLVENIRKDLEHPSLSLGAWLQNAEVLRARLEAKYGANHFPSAVDILNQVREERDDDILNSLRR